MMMTDTASTGIVSPYLTKREAADYAKVSERTIDRWRSELGLEASEIGGVIRFHIAKLQTFLDRNGRK